MQVNAAGIFPVLGSRGAYWAVFFWLSLPQSLLRSLSTLGSAIVYNLLALARAPPFAQYYYQVSV